MISAKTEAQIGSTRHKLPVYLVAFQLMWALELAAAWQLEPLMLVGANQLLTPSFGPLGGQLQSNLLTSNLAPEAAQAQPQVQQQTPPRPIEELAKSAIGGLVDSVVNVSLAAPSPAPSSSPAAKMFEAAAKAVAEQAANLTADFRPGASNSSRLLGAASQLMKPRKQVASASKLEEQIINQHARVHPGAGSHQRLLATKQRDNKILGSLDASGSSQRFSLGGLVEQLKSASISSRSSIVKAISDNKLARSK